MSQSKQFQMVQQYTLDEDEPPSRAVYSTVAAVENRSPLDLTPLAEVTDPDALIYFLVVIPRRNKSRPVLWLRCDGNPDGGPSEGTRQ